MKATKKASVYRPAPNARAITASRTKPKTREISVMPLTVTSALSRFTGAPGVQLHRQRGAAALAPGRQPRPRRTPGGLPDGPVPRGPCHCRRRASILTPFFKALSLGSQGAADGQHRAGAQARPPIREAPGAQRVAALRVAHRHQEACARPSPAATRPPRRPRWTRPAARSTRWRARAWSMPTPPPATRAGCRPPSRPGLSLHPAASVGNRPTGAHPVTGGAACLASHRASAARSIPRRRCRGASLHRSLQLVVSAKPSRNSNASGCSSSSRASTTTQRTPRTDRPHEGRVADALVLPEQRHDAAQALGPVAGAEGVPDSVMPMMTISRGRRA